MWDQIPTDLADLVIFTEEIFNGKLHFLCSDTWYLILEFLIPIFKEMY